MLEEKFATRPGDIDVIYVYGFGFPRYRGGPMFYADTVGLPTVLSRVHEYRARFGDYWEPAPLLEKLVAEGRGILLVIDIDVRTIGGRVGEEIAVSDWFEVTQARINQFADATGDHQWIHVDPVRAAAELPSRHHDRARLPHAVAAQHADPRVDPRHRSADGDQLRPQPRAVRLAGPVRLAHPRADHARRRSTPSAADSRSPGR